MMVFLSGCSVYRSEGRKQFESEVNEKAAAFTLLSCKTEGKLQSWFEEEFPLNNYELVLSEPDLEIWKAAFIDHVEVRALQKNDNGNTQACVYRFANEMIWNLHKENFIQELENNSLAQ
jgi:hypothetical protein